MTKERSPWGKDPALLTHIQNSEREATLVPLRLGLARDPRVGDTQQNSTPRTLIARSPNIASE